MNLAKNSPQRGDKVRYKNRIFPIKTVSWDGDLFEIDRGGRDLTLLNTKNFLFRNGIWEWTGLE